MGIPTTQNWAEKKAPEGQADVEQPPLPAVGKLVEEPRQATAAAVAPAEAAQCQWRKYCWLKAVVTLIIVVAIIAIAKKHKHRRHHREERMHKMRDLERRVIELEAGAGGGVASSPVNESAIRDLIDLPLNARCHAMTFSVDDDGVCFGAQPWMETSWAEAKATCEAIGGHPATFSGRHQLQRVARRLQKATDIQVFWAGVWQKAGAKREPKGDWIYGEGGVGPIPWRTYQGFRNFDEPNEYLNISEDCGAGTEGGFLDLNCHAHLNFLCRFDCTGNSF